MYRLRADTCRGVIFLPLPDAFLFPTLYNFRDRGQRNFFLFFPNYENWYEFQRNRSTTISKLREIPSDRPLIKSTLFHDCSVESRLKFLPSPSILLFFAEEEEGEEEREEEEEDMDSFLEDFLPRGGGEWEPPPTKGSRRATPTRGIRDIDDARRPISSRRRRATRRRCAPSSWFTCNASSKTRLNPRLTWPCCHSRGCATTSATCRLFTRGGVIIKGQPRRSSRPELP